MKTMGLITGALIVNPVKAIGRIIKPDWHLKIKKNGDFILKDWNGIEPGFMSYENNCFTISGQLNLEGKHGKTKL